jgi:hypothetical protein
MIVMLSAVRLVTAPFRSAISFGNAGVQLGAGGMTKVLNWMSNMKSVGTTTLKGLWQTNLQDVETGTINFGAVYARGGANGPTDEEITKASVA